MAWPFLRNEQDVSEDLRAKAAELEDLLARETFYRELPTIEQHASAVDAEYARRFDEALEARIASYTQALDGSRRRLAGDSIGPGSAEEVGSAAGARNDTGSGARADSTTPVELMPARPVCRMRSQSCTASLTADRVATVKLSGYFSGGIEDRRAGSMPLSPAFGRNFAPDRHRQEGDCPVIGAHHG